VIKYRMFPICLTIFSIPILKRESLNQFLKIHYIIICVNVVMFKYRYFILLKKIKIKF